MAQDKEKQPIIIKRVSGGGEGHHGGAWKIAYADFVTAMMAFFLLMWLLASTTEEERKAIGDFFSGIPVADGGTFGLLRGQAIDDSDDNLGKSVPAFAPSLTRNLSTEEPTDEELAAEEVARQAEQAAFASTEEALERALQQRPELAQNVLLERTPDGLRIQIVDQEQSPMFASGSAVLVPKMEQLLKLVASLVSPLPNPIALSGHTDSYAFSRENYGNWELSADRANAARRSLLGAGIPEARISRVLGLADKQPLVKDDPAAPRNRRIAILLMSQVHKQKN